MAVGHEPNFMFGILPRDCKHGVRSTSRCSKCEKDAEHATRIGDGGFPRSGQPPTDVRELDDIPIVRRVRVIEYIGPRAWVEQQLENRWLKGTFVVAANKRMNEAVLGDIPEFK